MPRAQKGAARRQSRKRWFEKMKGNRGARNNLWSRAKETVYRAGTNTYKHRRERKREYRKLWIIRINAGCAERGINYSRFMAGLKNANVTLNRKMLSEIAIHDPQTFDKLVEQAKAAGAAPKVEAEAA